MNAKDRRRMQATLEQFRTAHQAQPFRPFLINLADGRRVEVRHPEFVAYTGGGRTIFVGAEEGDGYTIIDLLLVTSIEVRDSGAGRARRRAG